MKKNVLINLRVEEDLKERFQQIANENGYSMSDLLTASMKEIVRRGNIPLYLSSKLPKRNNSIISIQEIKIALNNILLTKNYHKQIKRASIFGSYATGEMTSKSDIDLLIKTGDSFGLFDLADLTNSLEQALKKKVDITIENNNDPYFLSIINREKIIIYEKQ